MIIENKKVYNAVNYLVERVPIHILDLLYKVTEDDKWDNFSTMLTMVRDKVDEMIDNFDFFVQGNWEYENKRIYESIQKLDQKSFNDFKCDTKDIDWKPYLKKYIEGMCVWCTKEQKMSPVHDFYQILVKDKLPVEHSTMTIQKGLQSNTARPARYAQSTLFYGLNKMFGHAVEGVFLNMTKFKSIKNLLKDNRQKVIFYPMSTCSYLDLLVMFYISVLKLQGGGTILHQTEMSDMLLKACKMEKISKYADAGQIQQSIRSSLKNEQVTTLISSAFKGNQTPTDPCKMLQALVSELSKGEYNRWSFKFVGVSINYDNHTLSQEPTSFYPLY